MTVTTTEARDQFAELLNRAAYGGERVVLTRRGKELAALISIEDLRLLERLIEEVEDRIDVEEARKALAEMEATGEEPIPAEELWKRLGLQR